MATETVTFFACDCCRKRTDKYSQVGFHRIWFQKYDVCKECYRAFTALFDALRHPEPKEPKP